METRLREYSRVRFPVAKAHWSDALWRPEKVKYIRWINLMPLSDADLYKAHVKNLRAVEDSISHIERDLNRAISEDNSSLADTLKKLYLLLAGAWAECRLKKLIYEADGFSSSDRSSIRGERSQSDRWKKAVELGYRKRYKVRKASLSELSLQPTSWFRYVALKDIITQELEPLIELRNTLAHGQWVRPLNSAETDISGKIIGSLNQENALSVKFKIALIEDLSNLIHDLVAATSFERDFDLHYRHIVATRTSLQRRSYEHWRQSMIEKRERGRQKRNAAIRSVAG